MLVNTGLMEARSMIIRQNPFASSISRIRIGNGSSSCLRQSPASTNPNNALFSGLLLASTLKLKSCSVIVGAMEKSSQGSFDATRKRLFSPLPINTRNLTKSLEKFVLTNFLPLALISAVTLGLVNPTPGCIAHRYSLTKFATFGIFFISGLQMRGGELGSAVKAWPVALFGLASIMLFSPVFSKLFLQFHLAPQEFVTGLAVFCCMPTTLSCGVALTQLIGGNAALALTLTVISNLLGIITVPFWVSRFFVDGYGVSIPTSRLFWNLMITLLVPLVLGKVLRDAFQGLATFVDQNKRILSMTSTILLSLTPWMQVSKSRPLLLMVKPQVFLEAIGMGILVHLTFLGFNAVALRMVSTPFDDHESPFLKKENFRAILLVCSQKAFLIVVAVIEQLNGALGEAGLLVLPCIAAHINQIIIDSFLVNFWLQKDQACALEEIKTS